MIVYRELSSLEQDLGIPAAALYAVSRRIGRHYHTVTIPKSDGSSRRLSVPDPLLKHIQRRITDILLIHMPIAPCATAYRFGGSAIRNAAPHVGAPQLLQLDIRDYFGSVLYTQIKDKAFPPEIYAEPLRVLLTVLCSYRSALPQGAPSSPAISNLILRDVDEELLAYCAPRRIRYTRYCDDLSFSGSFDPQELTAVVSAALRREGFFLKSAKTRLSRPGQSMCVTGLQVQQSLSVPAAYRRALRQELYYCRRFGLASHLEHQNIPDTPEHYAQRLLGRVNYVLSVTPTDRDFLADREWLLSLRSP